MKSFFAKIIIFLFLFLVAASANGTRHEDFFQCLSAHISNPTSTHEPIIHTPNDNNSSYSTILTSSIHNHRFSTPSTPKPTAIITPSHASHIQATVFCSKEHGVQIRIRSGGHDYEGLSYTSYNNKKNVTSLFVVIDLRHLSSISVDVESQSAWVQTGATLGQLYYRIAEKSENLAFPAGDCHTVGMGGQIGGGGYGYLTRKHGLAADNVLDAEIIDAQGRILDRKSMGEDLFWAIRGGGAASFGIVLAWKVRLVPVPSKVTVLSVWRNMEHEATKKFLHRWQRNAHKVDEDLSIYITFVTASYVDEQGNKKIVVEANVRVTFHGAMNRFLELMQEEFPELGLQRQECHEMRWVESFRFFNLFRNDESLDVLLSRKSNYNLMSFKVKSDYVKEPIPDDVFEAMLGRLYEIEVGRAYVYLFPYGGKMNEILESAIPLPYRAGNLYMLHYIVRWEEEEEEEKHLSWIRGLYNYM
ncbi:hypothetical protein TIFTF001_048235, partial [Ficus carica]